MSGTIQYPALQAPVLTAAQTPETVTEDRWHRPWSHTLWSRIAPGLAIALAAASGVSFNPLPIPPFAPTADKYWIPWSDPVRIPLQLYAASQQTLALAEAIFLETVTEDRWHVPWSEPSVKAKAGLATASQQALALTEAAPFPETVTESRWHAEWSQPVRVKPGIGAEQQHAYIIDNPVVPVVYIDHWLFPWSEPVRLPIGQKVFEQKAEALVKAAPFPETVLESKFHFAWSEPVRIPQRLHTGNQQTLSLVIIPPVVSPFFPVWSTPVWPRPGLNASQQMHLNAQVIVPPLPSPQWTLANAQVRVRFLGLNVPNPPKI